MTPYQILKKLAQVPEEKVLEIKSPIAPDITMFDNKKDYLDTLQEGIDSIKQYFNAVIDHVTGSVLAKEKYKGEISLYQNEITKLDKSRKLKHDAAMVQCNMINRLCDTLNIEHFCDVDTQDRHAVNAFMYKFCIDVYKEGSPHLKNFDEYINIDSNSISAQHNLDSYIDSFKDEKSIKKDINIKEEFGIEDL